MTMTTTITGYAFKTDVDLPLEAAVERVTAALGDQGFGILTEIDVKATLKKKLNTDFRKYVILGRATRVWPTKHSLPRSTSALCCPAASPCMRTTAAAW